jgi:beta-1,4-mannosyl-glycoprotein beta-1,4-N-acetylglucosaminyltransferase
MAGVDKIIKKLESFAHQEFNKPEYKDPEKIRELINSGKDVLFPQNSYYIQELNDKLPTYLVKNRHKFEEFLLSSRD